MTALDVVVQRESIHKDHPSPDFHIQGPELSPSVMAAFATVHHRFI